MSSWISDGVTSIERSLVGTAIVNGWPAVASVATKAHEFYDLRLQACWSAICALADRSEPVDVVTVERELEKQGKRDAVGNLLFDLVTVPLTTVPGWNAAEIRQAWLSRETRKACGTIAAIADMDGEELLAKAHRDLQILGGEVPRKSAAIRELVLERMGELEQICADKVAGKHALVGQPTGVAALDAKIGGWQRGIVSLVAARPSMGKSSLGLSTAFAHVGGAFGGCHVFSLEDVRGSYTDRALSRLSGISSEVIRSCEYNREQIQCLNEAAQKLGRARGWRVDDRSGLDAQEIVRAWRAEREENDTRTALIDYWQILKWPNGARSEQEALKASMDIFADAAKEDKMAVVLFSQLNRDLEKRDDKRPTLADIKGSGSGEERAKCVIGLHRGSEYYRTPKGDGIDYDPGERQPTEEEFRKRADLLVLKNSNGGRNTVVRANWNGATTRIW